MPRPSLKAERTVELLDAFASCVARFGLEGATLERIAENAGVKRPILRHYLGNRDAMIDRLIEHVLARFARMTAALVSELPDTGRLDALLDRMFHFRPRAPADASIFQALVAAADRYPKIRSGMLDFLQGMEAAVAGEVARAFPAADAAHCRRAGAGIVAIYFNAEAVGSLRPPRAWITRQRQAAETLLSALEHSGRASPKPA